MSDCCHADIYIIHSHFDSKFFCAECGQVVVIPIPAPEVVRKSAKECECIQFCGNFGGCTHSCHFAAPEGSAGEKEWEKQLEEEWQRTFGKTDILLAGLVPFRRIKSFISKLLATEYERGRNEEAERWMNQPANQHDARIRTDERKHLKDLIDVIIEDAENCSILAANKQDARHITQNIIQPLKALFSPEEEPHK